MLMRSSIRLQAGMTILEALIAIVILSIMGLGSAFIAAKTLMIQKEASLNNLIINGARNVAQQQDCTSLKEISVNAEKSLVQSINCATGSKVAAITASDASHTLVFQINTDISIPGLTTTNDSSLVKDTISIQP